MDDLIINFDDTRERANYLRMAGKLRGKQRIITKQYRATRSNQQNRRLWGVLYAAFVEFRQLQGEEFTAEMAHHFFGLKFLRKTIVDHDSGEILGTTIPSTTKLNVSEFNEYMDKIEAWLAEYDIEVPPQEDRTMSNLPTQPGWWVQWAGRSDWQPMDEASAKLLARTIVASGDKVVHVEGESQNTFDPKIAAKRTKLLRSMPGAK